MAVCWLRFRTSNSGASGFIFGGGTKILHAMKWNINKYKKNNPKSHFKKRAEINVGEDVEKREPS